MPILRSSSKAARKAARAPLGKIEHGGITKARQNRNLRSAAYFMAWTMMMGIGTTADTELLRQAMVSFIGHCWQEGDGKDICCSAIYGICALLSLESKVFFKTAWKLLKRWSVLELPQQAPPALRLEVLALAGLAWNQQKKGLAIGILLAYDLFLRTGEWTNLRLDAIEAGSSAATISLGLTKGVQRRGGVESVTCRDPLLVRQLVWLKAERGGGKLVEDSEAHIRVWLKQAAVRLGIADRKLTPYSFRRGGLSAASLDGVPVSTLALRARWLDARIATVYIQEGEQTLRAIKMPPAVTSKLQTAAKLLFQ